MIVRILVYLVLLLFASLDDAFGAGYTGAAIASGVEAFVVVDMVPRTSKMSTTSSSTTSLRMSKQINKLVYKSVKQATTATGSKSKDGIVSTIDSQTVTSKSKSNTAAGDITSLLGQLICPVNVSSWIFYATMYAIYQWYSS